MTDGASPFHSAAPIVRLLPEESTAHPFAVTIAAAWSCYGAKPANAANVLKLIHGDGPADATPEQIADRLDRRERALKLYADLFAAGHHTTFQHSNFTFVLDNISRLAIWSFFHSHPHYNSEQVSQRYREVSGAVMTTPDLPAEQLAIYQHAIDTSLEGYRRLTEILSVDALAGYESVFPSRVKAEGPEAQAKLDSAIQKKAQEVARYVLPLATPAHLYHTVNGLTLLRYLVLAAGPDVPTEVQFIVQQMVDQVLAIDPLFLGSPRYPLNLRPLLEDESLESQTFARWHESVGQRPEDAERFVASYDAQLGTWRSSRLSSWNPDGERVLADAVRTVLGSAAVADEDAISAVLSGSENAYLGHSLYLGMNSKLMQTLNHVPFTFQKRISGAEDAQNQRHRGTLASRPVLQAHLLRSPDVIVPWAIQRNPGAMAVYEHTVNTLWDAKNKLIDAGAPVETALYLLPNSHRVRFFESGTLMTYYWKWIKRLCYDAQREIFETAVEEVAQVREVYPIIGRYVDGPPCVMRSRTETRPFCPEGERFCGVPVWRNYQFETLADRRVL